MADRLTEEQQSAGRSHDRGVSSVEGLYFLGLPWLYTWGSGRFSGIARDAEYLAERVGARTATLARAA